MARQSSRPVDLDTQLRDIRRQLNDQLGCLDFRMESKLSLLAEFQEFFKKRGEVEYEYARSLERLCEKFERSTKQRSLKNEVRSTFNLWSTILAETRKLSRERASLGETLASEMVARLEIMAKDVHILTKKCREICVEVQDHFLKELRDLGEQTKVYHHSCYNSHEAEVKLVKSQEKVDAARNNTHRHKKALEKEAERKRQYKVQRHLVMKNRNDLLVDISKCNAFSMQYFNMDVMDIIEYMDYDYHASFERLATAYKEAEAETCEAVMCCARSVIDQAKGLNFENDLHYFLSENPGPFTPPNPFTFQPYEGDDVMEYKVNTQDVFERAKKTVETIHSTIQTLEIQREEDVKTVQHMEQVNLKKFRVTSVEDALAVLEEAGDAMAVETGAQSRGSASLDRGLAYQTKASQAITLSQRGKKDALHFTLGVLQRRVNRSDRLALAHSQLDILEKSLDEQKVPPVPVGVDASGQSVPGEVPTLFGGHVVEYLKATGCEIPLIVTSCIRAIEKEGVKMEGLFRVPGPAAYTEDLRKAFEEGRDPLLYISKKVDIAGVASVLKGYFRELRVPLFPTENYKAFIDCTRREDVTSRLESIQNTLTLVHPAVVKVMRYLFKFLHKVSLHSTENKMTSANLALVFGPTLTRAPPDADPRQLHNDVPAVNMLIQLCIDHHSQVFGEEEESKEDEEEDAAMMAPPPSYSPPHDSPVWPTESAVSPPPTEPSSQVKVGSLLSTTNNDPASMQQKDEEEEELESNILSPPPPPSMEPEDMTSPPPAYVPLDEPPDPVSPPLPPYEEPEQPPEDHGHTEGGQQLGKAEESAAGPAEDMEGKEDASGVSLSGEWSALDETVKDMQASLEELTAPEEGGGEGVAKSEGEEVVGKSHGSESESESEDDEDEDDLVMSVSARALYDYSARSDKELSFKRGDTLKVIEKSPDGHWWDGLCGSNRGFIPVAYVEIIELQTTPSTAELAPVPPPPARRSSMQEHKEDEAASAAAAAGRVSEAPAEASILEVPAREPSCSPEPPKLTLTEAEAVEEVEQKLEKRPVSPSDLAKQEPPAPKPPITVTSSVKSLSKQFASPTPPAQVLVSPHRKHTELSPRKSYEAPVAAAGAEGISRSASTSGGRVAQQLKKNPPPPTKPRPSHTVSPGADRATASFQISPHSSTTGSPLQQAQLGSQLGAKTTPGSSKAPAKPRSSALRKSQKKDDRPPLPSKPVAKPPPPAKASTELQAELQAAVGKRRPTE